VTTHPETGPGAARRVCEALLRYRRLVITSHMRPDGDSVGSSLALAWALRELGADARVVHRDRPPLQLADSPGVEDVEIGDAIPAGTEAVVVLECGISRGPACRASTVCRSSTSTIIRATRATGDVRWFDGTASALAEMIFEIIAELGVPLTAGMATQLFVAVVTDTGSFRYPGVSPRTFSICARLLEAGADPVSTARRLYDSHTLGRLRLQGAVLRTLEIDASGRLAMLTLTDAMLAESGGAPDRNRRSDQPAPRREGGSGRRVLQGGRARPVAREPAVQRRHRRRPRRPRLRRRRAQERLGLHARGAPRARCAHESSSAWRPTWPRPPGPRLRRPEPEVAASPRREDAGAAGRGGVLVIDKPAGPTSHDIVAVVRRRFRGAKVGHTGTLDPFATGVLPVVVGRATRLARYLSGAEKEYDALLRLGRATDTHDATGRVVFEAPVTVALPPRERVAAVLDRYRGTWKQTPPAYSANSRAASGPTTRRGAARRSRSRRSTSPCRRSNSCPWTGPSCASGWSLLPGSTCAPSPTTSA